MMLSGVHGALATLHELLSYRTFASPLTSIRRDHFPEVGPMTRRDWWLGILVRSGVLLAHLAFPRYEVRFVNGAAIRVDRWMGAIARAPTDAASYARLSRRQRRSASAAAWASPLIAWASRSPSRAKRQIPSI
jgi:hypothetical protein